MKPQSFLVWGVSLVGVSLLPACASNPKKGDACCSSGGAASSAATVKSVAQGSGKAASGASAPGSASGKVREHLTDSTQHEIVRETKPVIGDDSELRK